MQEVKKRHYNIEYDFYKCYYRLEGFNRILHERKNILYRQAWLFGHL